QQFDELVAEGATPFRVTPRGTEFGRSLGADAEGWKKPPFAQEVERRAFLGQDERIAKRQHDSVHPELDALCAPRDDAERGHRFELEVLRNEPLADPDGVDGTVFAEVEPFEKRLWAGKRET